MTKQKRVTHQHSKPHASKSAPQAGRFGIRPDHIRLIGGVLLVAVFMGVVIFLQMRGQSAPAPVSSTYMAGNIQNCAGSPPFLQTLGFTQNIAYDTRAKFVKGLAIRQLSQNGSITRSYQDPSWMMAGYLGSLQRDMQGNIFLIPVPAINILDNPPLKSNIVYRISGSTGQMTPLVDLPGLSPVNPQNPYGLLNLTYDCETRSLYASSVYGSSYDHIAGCIFQIDSITGVVRSKLEYVDAYGVGVFNTINGKRLYFGLARSPDIYSVALDEKGIISKEVRKEPALTVNGISSDERAQSIKFQDPNQMVIKAAQFDFNLTAPTEVLQTLITYAYDFHQDTWQYVSAQVVSG